MNEIKHISPSQISTYDLCNRKWYINKILKQDIPGSPATRLGTEVHGSTEDFLLDRPGGEVNLHAVAKPALHHLTHWRNAVRNGHGFVESDMKRRMRNGLDFVGRVDLRIRIPGQPSVVVDHKTISNADYAKDEEDLQSNTQMLAYAYDEYCVRPQPLITVAHSSMQTRGAPRHVYTETPVTAPQIMAGWAKIQDKSDEMLGTSKVASFVDVPGNKRSCHAFNQPCPFLAMCEAHIVRSPNTHTYDTRENDTMSTAPTVAAILDALDMTHPSKLPLHSLQRASDYVAGMEKADYPWAPTGSTPAVKTTGSILPPEVQKGAPVAEPTPAKAPPTQAATDAEIQALLLANGWSAKEVGEMADTVYSTCANNIKRDVAEIERDAEGYIAKVTKKGGPAPRRVVTTISPSGAETTKVEPTKPAAAADPAPRAGLEGAWAKEMAEARRLGWPEEEIKAMTNSDLRNICTNGEKYKAPKVEPVPTQRASGKDRRPVRAAEKLAALDYPAAVIEGMTHPQMHDAIDGGLKYAAPVEVPYVDEKAPAGGVNEELLRQTDVSFAEAEPVEKTGKEILDIVRTGGELDVASEMARLEQENDEVREALEERTLQLTAAREIADGANKLLNEERAKIANLEKAYASCKKDLEEALVTGALGKSGGTDHVGPTLYIGCFPDMRPAKSTHLDIALAPAMEAAAKNYRDEKGNVKPLVHYGLIPFGAGSKVVASLILANIQEFVVEHPVLYVDPSSPCAGPVLEVLRPHYNVVQRVS